VQVRCPTCKREIEWSPDNRFRPFCGERCRMVDLGAWFTGERAIPDGAPSTLDGEPSSEIDQRSTRD
jgi:endogenous inhibitor of DNA gyrase (YacG/DUF329 family)